MDVFICYLELKFLLIIHFCFLSNVVDFIRKLVCAGKQSLHYSFNLLELRYQINRYNLDCPLSISKYFQFIQGSQMFLSLLNFEVLLTGV